jgi:hypothetical protein
MTDVRIFTQLDAKGTHFLNHKSSQIQGLVILVIWLSEVDGNVPYGLQPSAI